MQYEITGMDPRNGMIWYSLTAEGDNEASAGIVLLHEDGYSLSLGETVEAEDLGKDSASFIYKGRTCKWEEGRWRWT